MKAIIEPAKIEIISDFSFLINIIARSTYCDSDYPCGVVVQGLQNDPASAIV